MSKTEIVAILKAALERTYVIIDEEHLMAQEYLIKNDETPKSEIFSLFVRLIPK